MQQENRRNPYIDMMKGLGILLVILGHLIPRGALWNIIYAMHMPLFVFCSGFVEKPSLKWRRIIKLLLGYAVMAAISCGIYYLLWEAGNFYYIKQTVFNILVGGHGPSNGVYPVEALWFLPCLVIIIVMYHLLNKIKRTWIQCAVLGLCILCGAVLTMHRDRLPMLLSLDISLFLLPFFYFGAEFRDKANAVSGAKSRLLFIFVVISSILYYFLAQWNGETNLYRGMTGRNLEAYYSLAFMGIAIAMCSCILIKRCSKLFSGILRFLGNHTLVMMGCHQLLILLLKDYVFIGIRPELLFLPVTIGSLGISIGWKKIRSADIFRRGNIRD